MNVLPNSRGDLPWLELASDCARGSSQALLQLWSEPGEKHCSVLAVCLTWNQALSAAPIWAWLQGWATNCDAESLQPSLLRPWHYAAPAAYLIHPADRQHSPACRWNGAGTALVGRSATQVPASAGVCWVVSAHLVRMFSSPQKGNQQHCYQTLPGRDICSLNGLCQMKGIEAQKSSTSLFPNIISIFRQFICLLTGRF